MDVKMELNVKGITKEDLRDFLQLLRQWELRTSNPKSQVVAVLFHTDPQMSTAEVTEMFESIYPKLGHIVVGPASQSSILSLGMRALTVGGKLLGTCDELTLTIGAASEEEIRHLQEAQTISLVKMGQG